MTYCVLLQVHTDLMRGICILLKHSGECLFCVCGKISNSSFCEVPCYYNKGVSFIRRAAEEEQNIDPQPMTFGFVGLKITKEMVEHVTMNTWQVLFHKHVKVKR